MYVAPNVRRACRVAGIFVRVDIGLWKVRRTSAKVGMGVESVGLFGGEGVGIGGP